MNRILITFLFLFSMEAVACRAAPIYDAVKVERLIKEASYVFIASIESTKDITSDFRQVYDVSKYRSVQKVIYKVLKTIKGEHSKTWDYINLVTNDSCDFGVHPNHSGSGFKYFVSVSYDSKLKMFVAHPLYKIQVNLNFS